MTVLDRFKVEISHKDYFNDDEYTMYLQENNLTATDTYDKATMQRNLLLTVVDVLEAVSNDVDLMRKLQDTTTGFTVSQAYAQIKQRIADLKDRIATLPAPDADDTDNSVVLLFTKDRM